MVTEEEKLTSKKDGVKELQSLLSKRVSGFSRVKGERKMEVNGK